MSCSTKGLAEVFDRTEAEPVKLYLSNVILDGFHFELLNL